MRLSKFVRFQDLRVAGRGPGTIRQGPMVAGDVSRVADLGPSIRSAGKGRGYKGQV